MHSPRDIIIPLSWHFAFQTVTSLYEAVVPPSEKCINYVNSVEVSRSEEKLSEEVNNVVEAETHLTILEPEEGLADRVNERTPELSQATLQDNREREIPVEVELVELITSVNEILQFPEIEEILDSGKTSEIGEVRLKRFFFSRFFIIMTILIRSRLLMTNQILLSPTAPKIYIYS